MVSTKYRLWVFTITLTTLAILVFVLGNYFLSQGASSLTSRVYEYRFYRIFIAVATGMILGFTGSYMQASLRNPLVDHYILGVGGGALFTVYLTVMFLPKTIPWIISLAAIAGGFTALFLTIAIAESIGGSDIAYVLSGIGVSAMFSGLSITLSFIISTKNPYAIHLLLGSLITVSRKWFPAVIVLLAILWFSYILLSKPLNTLLLGDLYSKQLGFNPRLYRFLAITIAGASASITVAYCGIIGFIGLVSPHIARLLLKTVDNRFVIPVAGLVGSILLLLTDNISRVYLASSIGEVPVGALTSAFGAPFFLVLLVRRFRGRGL